MFRSIVIILFLTSFYLLGQTNIYHPFPFQYAVWMNKAGGIPGSCGCCSGSPCVFDMDVSDSLSNEDTLIGHHVYKKLYEGYIKTSYYAGPVTCPPWCTPQGAYIVSQNYQYIGAIRQDVINKKVYFAPAGQPAQLLYDFNLNIGDTLPYSYINHTPYPKVVTNIDSVLVNGNYHKRFGIGYSGYPGTFAYLIEGIGSSLGLLFPLEIPFEVNTMLTCVRINNQTIYPVTTPSFNCQYLPLNIEEKNIHKKSDLISIFPNPFSTHCDINFNEKVEGDFYLFNCLGQLVEKIRINGDKLTLFRQNLSPGVYCYQFINHSSDKNPFIVFGKLMIQN
ncbi:MAG: hypothetical protein KatS3mg027_0181 [Bacteroidia bacterium]|nr:MAG: hypothetical protein KatS3mg027_0181 [Bacteroidia bacterium]